MSIVTFDTLAIGARFKHLNCAEIWVKIGANTIAKWLESEKTIGWTAQPICSYSETEEGVSTLVDVL